MVRVHRSFIVAAVGGASLLGSCRRDAPTSLDVAQSRAAAVADREASPGVVVVYGPATFTRDNARPHTDSATFAAHAGDTLTFAIASGDGRGLEASIAVNGRRLWESDPADDHDHDRGHADARDHDASLHVVAQATNTLRVTMTGKPGSSLHMVATVPAPKAPVEPRVLSVLYGSGISGSVPAGDLAVAPGTRVRYGFAAKAGYRHLRVVIDGQMADDSGTITMDRAHWVTASADTVIVLDATEQAVATRLRGVLTSATPRTEWRAYQSAVDQAGVAWGDQAAGHFARIEAATIDPVRDLARLVRLDSALAGMETPIEWPATGSALRMEPATGGVARSALSRAAFAQDSASGREATHILLVNGIYTNQLEFEHSTTLLRLRLAEDPLRFPRSTTTLSHFYNSSLFNLSEAGRLAAVCAHALGVQSALRGGQIREVLSVVPMYVACVIQLGRYSNDISEMLRWAHDALAGAAQQDYEVDEMARLMQRNLFDARRHVLVIGHSEGSLLTQLAVQRLQRVYGFNELRSPQCVGTVSLAGVGTANWPLSDRHARFVVANHDLVTMLPGNLANRRPTVNDMGTLAFDAFLGELSQAAGGQLSGSVLLTAVELVGGSQIHHLDRYLQSPEMWAAISNGLDELYRTCAVGTVVVNPAAAKVQVFGASTFGATWRALDGQPLATTDSAHWSLGSALASVNASGRLVAGAAPGTVTLQATVRHVTGTATVTIADDSVRALAAPPMVSVAERTTIGFQQPGPLGAMCDTRSMTISATAAAGATIASVQLFRRSAAQPYIYESLMVPLDQEFTYLTANCTFNGQSMASGLDFAWYRLVVTDSHGLVTETTGPTP